MWLIGVNHCREVDLIIPRIILVVLFNWTSTLCTWELLSQTVNYVSVLYEKVHDFSTLDIKNNYLKLEK